jgi:hypothetical protein
MSAYAREAKRTPASAKEVRDDPTVFDYEVTADVDAGGPSIRPVTGAATACRPSE